MEKLFEQLIQSAKTNRKGFLRLKNAVVTCQQFELASALREIELKAFPETDEIKEAKNKVQTLKLALKLVDISVKDEDCWLVYETFKLYDKIGVNFSLEEASKLLAMKQELYPAI
jgi:uncharacterized protein YydD (DUF2326 family)